MCVQWATSIPPKDDVTQQMQRIHSWGGEVTAFQTAEELPIISDSYPDLSVQLAVHSGQRLLGKPVPQLKDIFSAQYALTEDDAQVFGLMNADITWEATDVQQQLLQQKAQNALVCIRRVDVDDVNVDLNKGTQLPQGYDTFLYPRHMIPDLQVDDFCLGAPFWDFWMPVAAMLAGYPVVEVTAPIARHINHDVRWGQSAKAYIDIFIRSVSAASIRTTRSNPILSALCAHNVAAYGAWTEITSQSAAASQVLNHIFDDFQSRMMGVVGAYSEKLREFSACRDC